MAGLLCPHCGIATSFNPAPIRGQGVLVDYSDAGNTVKGQVAVSAVVDDRNLAPHFAVVQCAGCDKLFVAGRHYGHFGDWETAWPLVTRDVSRDLPDLIRTAFEDALTCRAANGLGGCLMMCRTTLIRLLRDQGASSLKELRDKGMISDALFQQADEVRLWANVIGHEDYDAEVLTRELSDELVTYIESLLDAVYVQPAKLARHRELRKQATSEVEGSD